MNLIELFNNTAGPLPLKTALNIGDAKSMRLFASGSAYRSDAGPIQCEIVLDGVVVSTMMVFTNEPNSHKAFVPVYQEISGFDGPQANFEIRVKDSNTVVDSNDYFNLSIILES